MNNLLGPHYENYPEALRNRHAFEPAPILLPAFNNAASCGRGGAQRLPGFCLRWHGARATGLAGTIGVVDYRPDQSLRPARGPRRLSRPGRERAIGASAI